MTDIFEPDIPLSQASRDILDELSQPVSKRKPVSYLREFLDSYRPNEDSYLADDQIKRLTELGKMAPPSHPIIPYEEGTLDRLLIDLSWWSSRLEGNTYSLLETQRLIEFNEKAAGKDADESQMILNHKEAIRFLIQENGYIDFNKYTLLGLHTLLAHNLIQNKEAIGTLRKRPVEISGSAYCPSSIPQFIDEMFDVFLQKASQIKNPFEQSFFAMIHLPYLQPFEDVNKRVSRLAANIPFIKNKLAPLSFIGTPQEMYAKGLLGIYEKTQIYLLRDFFIYAYEQSSLYYSNLRRTTDDAKPDLFYLKHHREVKNTVSYIVKNKLSTQQALLKIKENSESLSETNKVRFADSVESSLLYLHEGHLALYRLYPPDFEEWKKLWPRKGRAWGEAREAADQQAKD